MKIISFVNMKGGVGKTTLAVNVADFLTRQFGQRVLLVDVDPQFNATQCLVSGDKYIEWISDNGSTIVDVFNSTKTSVSTIHGFSEKSPLKYDDIVPIHTERGYDLIPSQLDLFRFEMAPGQGTENRLKNFLYHLKDNDKYDICIIDCPPTPSVWMTSAIIASDYYAIPSRPDPISMTGLDLLDGIIRERKENYGCECKCIGLILTQVEKDTIVFSEALKFFSESEKWKSFLYKNYMLKRTAVARNQLNGKFIIDIDDSELKLQFSGIVRELLIRIGVLI